MAVPSEGKYESAFDVTLTPTGTAEGTIYYTTNGTDPTTSSTLYTDPIPVTENTTLKAVAVIEGRTPSEIRTWKYEIVTAAPTADPPGGTYTGARNVTLTTATDGAAIYYTTNGETPTTSSTRYTGPIPIAENTTLKAVAVKTGWTNSEVMAEVYTINKPPPAGTVAKPSANPAGGTYTGTQNVTLATSTEGASIYYTTNGVDPTISSTLYTVPIPVTVNTTIKAIAVKDGMTTSTVLTAAYSIRAVTPTAEPPEGTYEGTRNVTLTTDTAEALIYYTIDGTTPTTTSPLYNGLITVEVNTVIKAIAVKEGMTNSTVLTGYYYIAVAAPEADPPAGTYSGARNVTLTTATPGAAIYYTLDGTHPTTSSTRYNGPVSITAADTTIKAIAVKAEMVDSAVLTATYTIRYPVTYNTGGGRGTAPDQIPAIPGGSITLPGPGNMTAPADSVFIGWKSSLNGNVYYPAGASYTVNAAVTFTAQWTAEFTDTAQITAYLATIAEESLGSTSDDPVPLTVNMSTAGYWVNLLAVIENAGKYIALDLSDSVMNSSGTAFDPGTADTGEKFITALTLPTAAQSITGGSSDTSTFSYFTTLRAITGNNITSIGAYAFSDCTSLTIVNFPKATTIGMATFSDCISLTMADFSFVTDIGAYAFSDCTSLTMVNFPLVTDTGDYAFGFCTSLAEAYFPKAETIGRYTFYACTSLAEAYFPEAETIGECAFYGCTGLTTANFPFVTDIGDYAFYYGVGLTMAYFPLVTRIGYWAFDETGGAALAVTLGSTAPLVWGGSIFNNANNSSAKTVTVKVPYTDAPAWEAAGYNAIWQTSFSRGSTTLVMASSLE
jgi:hypothetical protein